MPSCCLAVATAAVHAGRSRSRDLRLALILCLSPIQTPRIHTRSYKRSMEYLFLGEHPALPGEMDRVIEAGVRHAGALGALVRTA